METHCRAATPDDNSQQLVLVVGTKEIWPPGEDGWWLMRLLKLWQPLCFALPSLGGVIGRLLHLHKSNGPLKEGNVSGRVGHGHGRGEMILQCITM